MAQAPHPSMAFLWPMLAAASAGEATSVFVKEMARLAAGASAPARDVPEPRWATRNRVALALPSMRLRDFSRDAPGQPTLICAPYALHNATVVDFAPGHSLVEALRASGRGNVFVTEWLSATPEMRFFSIDTLLADLNVAVDELRRPVDLIGLCQGGWMALLYAARFPEKVRRLVLAGAPVDIAAAESGLSRLAANTPISAFHDLLRSGEGRVLGRVMLEIWNPTPLSDQKVRDALQLDRAKMTPSGRARLCRRFRDWFDWTVDLPGVYYLQVVAWLYKENRLARGAFVALGKEIDLRAVRAPVALLAGRDDELVAPAQLLATETLIGAPRDEIKTMIAPCDHLGLFMGADILTRTWPEIVRWLDRGK